MQKDSHVHDCLEKPLISFVIRAVGEDLRPKANETPVLCGGYVEGEIGDMLTGPRPQ